MHSMCFNYCSLLELVSGDVTGRADRAWNGWHETVGSWLAHSWLVVGSRLARAMRGKHCLALSQASSSSQDQ